MIRVKLPFGGVTPDQMDAFADLAEAWTPLGKGHITTRQNFQFHHVPLEDAAVAIRKLGEVGLSSREACGNTVRNVTGDPWAGVLRRRALRPDPLRRRLRALLRPPPGHPADAAEAEDGVHRLRRRPGDHRDPRRRLHPQGAGDRRTAGARASRSGSAAGPRSCPGRPDAVPSSPSADNGDYLRMTEAALRIFDRQEWLRKNRARARIKVLVDKIGIEPSATWSTRSSRATGSTSTTSETSSACCSTTTSPSRRSAPRPTPMVHRTATAQRSTPSCEQTSSPSARRASRRPGQGQPRRPHAGPVPRHRPDHARVHRRQRADQVHQNIVLRWVRDEAVYDLWSGSTSSGSATPGVDEISDVVSCPGTDSCKLGITSSMGLNAPSTSGSRRCRSPTR